MLTLQTIRDHGPCANGWVKLTRALGTADLTTELSIGDIVLANGLADALWTLRCLDPRQRVAAIMPAVRRASAHTTDQRVHDCIAAVDKWQVGDDSVVLEAAWAAAAAEAAAWAAAAAAAWAAAWAAEAAAAWTAAWAAEAAERNQQEADLLAMFPPMRMTPNKEG